VLAQAEQWLSQRRMLWERRLDKLGEVLAAQEADERKTPRAGRPAATITRKGPPR
jgi:hypothetical protein